MDVAGTPHHVRVEGAAARTAGRTHRSSAASRGRRDRHRQDQPPRVRVRHHQRRNRRSARCETRSTSRDPPAVRAAGRRRAARGGHVLRRDRHRHRGLDPHSVSGVRIGRAQADLRRAVLRRRRAAQHHARSRRPDGALASPTPPAVPGDEAAASPRGRSRGARPDVRRAAAVFLRSAGRRSTRACLEQRAWPACARPATRCARSRSRERRGRPTSTSTSACRRRRAITRRIAGSHAAQYSPGVRLRLEMGRYMLAEDYVRAMRLRSALDGGGGSRARGVRRAAAAGAADRRARRSAPPPLPSTASTSRCARRC